LAERKIEPRLVVIEYNREIIDRDRYATTALSSGDALEIVKIVGGG
jgi:thiamine biosynthesis protein ThiS